jgi:hypothetical protein
MAKETEGKTVRLALTEEQKKQLAEALGEDIVKRIQHIEVDKIAGFLRSTMKVN